MPNCSPGAFSLFSTPRVSQIEKHERQRRKKWCVNFQSFLASKAFVLSALAAAAVRDKKRSTPRLVARKAAHNQLFEISIWLTQKSISFLSSNDGRKLILKSTQ
jgi:hypothetical protein